MNKEDLISIIVPIYNGEKYIKRCVDSVKNQTYCNWELILVNDGSTDNTKTILEKCSMEDERIILLHSENKGVCHARNFAIEACTGNYLIFVDVDDELEECALEEMHTLLIKNNVDIVIGQCTRIKEDGSIKKSVFPKNNEYWNGRAGLIASLKDHPATHSVWGKLYTRDIIDNTRFVVGKKVHEDSFFLFELFSKEPTVIVLNEYFYKYNITSDSVSRSGFSEKFFDIIFFCDLKKEIICNQYPELIEYVPNLVIKANIALLRIFAKNIGQKYRSYEVKCCKEIVQYKKGFIATTKEDKIWFWIITHKLYFVFKMVYIFKNAIRIKR